jgi:hypothetical protein
MALLQADEVANIAGQIKNTGFQVGNYGGGSAETYHYNKTGLAQNTLNTKPSQNLVGKIAAVGRETFGIGESVAKAGVKYVKSAPSSLYHGVQPFLQGVADVATGSLNHDLENIQKQNEQLEKNQQMYMDAYKSGKMGKDQYTRLMTDLSKSYSDLSKESQKVASKANRGDVIEGAANTAIDILSGGRLQLGGASVKLAATASLSGRLSAAELERVVAGDVTKQGAKYLAKGVSGDVSKSSLTTLIDQHATGLEKIVTKLPVVRNLLLRNTEQLAKLGIKQLSGESAAQFLVRESKNITVGLLIKRPLFYQLNIDSAKDIYTDMTSGKYGQAALSTGLQSLQLLEGPFAALNQAVKAGGGKIRNLAYGVGSVIDNVSREIGTGQTDQIARFVQSGEEVVSRSGKTTLSGEQVYRLIQENNLRGASENVDAAVASILQNYKYAGRKLETVTPKEIAQDYVNWQEAVDLAKGLSGRNIKGLTEEQARNLVVVRWDSIAKRAAYNRAIEAVSNGADVKALTDAVFDSNSADAIGNSWRNNPILAAQVTNILKDFVNTGETDGLKKILAIPTTTAIPPGIPRKVAEQLKTLGYGVAVPEGGVRKSAYAAVDDTRKLISSVTNEPTSVIKMIPSPDKGKTFYHGTNSKNVKSISELQSGKVLGSSSRNNVYMTENPEIAKHFGDNVVSQKLYGKHLNAQDIGVSVSPDPAVDKVAAPEFADYKTSQLLTEKDRRVFENTYIKEIPNNTIIEDTPDIRKYLASKGYTTLTVPRIHSDVSGARTETLVIDAKAFDKPKPTSETVTKDNTNLFDAATAPQPTLAHLAGFLNSAGLSPQANQQKAFQALSSGVAKSLDNLKVSGELGLHMGGNETTGGQVIMSKLEAYITNLEPSTFLRTATLTFGKARPAITDIRQLTTKEIRTALNTGNGGRLITEAEAKEIAKAINQGYLNTPLELRGLGDKVIDYLYKYNPAQKYYSRAQSALRYSYNPFFQAQEGFETAFFSGLSGGNKITSTVDHHLLWGKTKQELDVTVGQLEQARVFGGTGTAEGLLSSSLGGEAAQDLVIGRLTANITRGQKRDLAGLAQDIAARQGMTVQQMLDTHPEQLADALRIIVQYPREGVLASPLARTLNIAFFPMRYNAKVTIMAAKILAKQPPAVQFALTHSLLNFKDWLQSDEGIRWRAQNNDAIQVFNWISPLNNINGALNTLKYFEKTATGGKSDGIASLGQLGGLPFGVITQVLDSMGWISLNAPYVEPTSGDVLPDYIPNTTRAQAATAIVDLLGSIFTYPGRTLGLPGKQATLRNAVDGFTGTDASQFIKKTYQNEDGSLNARGQAELSDSQKALVRVLGGDTSSDALDRLYVAQNGMPMLPPTVLPFNVPEKIPLLSKTQLAAAKAAGKSAKGSSGKTVAKPVGQY